jgi:hypothetical protein
LNPQLSGLSQITLEDVEEATVNHYHIRWSQNSGETLDWEPFSSAEEAEAAAKQLMRPRKNYTIEQFDGECPRCRDGVILFKKA